MIKYIAMLDSKNELIITRNYNNYDTTFIELMLNSYIDRIEIIYNLANNSG